MWIKSVTEGAAELTRTTEELKKLENTSENTVPYKKKQEQEKPQKGVIYFLCGYVTNIPMKDRIKMCKARKFRYGKCKRLGHYQQACQSKTVNEIEQEEISM